MMRKGIKCVICLFMFVALLFDLLGLHTVWCVAESISDPTKIVSDDGLVEVTFPKSPKREDNKDYDDWYSYESEYVKVAENKSNEYIITTEASLFERNYNMSCSGRGESLEEIKEINYTVYRHYKTYECETIRYKNVEMLDYSFTSYSYDRELYSLFMGRGFIYNGIQYDITTFCALYPGLKGLAVRIEQSIFFNSLTFNPIPE